MAYDVSKLVKIGGLKTALTKVKDTYDAKVSGLDGRIQTLEKVGSQANVIESIKVNGTAQTITSKSVDITVPTKVSQITNDSNFQTGAQVTASINSAIAASGHAHFETAESVPSVDTAKENVMYLVKNSVTGYYDIYAKVGSEVVRLDDTTVDLSNYVTKVSGKGLSTNDFTNAYKTKLDGIETGANKYVHPTHTAAAAGLYKVTVDSLGHVTATTAVAKADITALGIPAQDTTYNDVTTSAHGLMTAADKTKLNGLNLSTDAEVTEMLNEVFGA